MTGTTTAARSRTGPRRRLSDVLPMVLLALATLGAIALVVLAIRRPEPPSYPPTPVGGRGEPDASGARVVTIDASSPDAWRFFSFERGILPGRAAGLDWDLAVRRFHIIANGGPGFAGGGAIQDLGPRELEQVRGVPADGWQPTILAGRDSVNRAIERWYSYGFTSHLLTPLGHTYAVRSADGRVFLVRIMGYYCPRATPGCVTLRWRPLEETAGGAPP